MITRLAVDEDRSVKNDRIGILGLGAYVPDRIMKFVLERLLGESKIEKKEKKTRKAEVQDEAFPIPPEIFTGDSELKEPETVASAPAPSWLKEELARHRILFLDIETQRSAEEVGGRHNKHLMRVAAAVVYDSLEDAFLVFEEDRVHELIEKLKTGELIVDFNIADFDYQVLKTYTPFRFQQLRTFDLLQEVSASWDTASPSVIWSTRR